MDSRISPAARAVARAWAGSRPILPVLLRDLAQQAQDHIDHGADPAYLELLASWMATAQPTWRDLSLAMVFPSAPRPLNAPETPRWPSGQETGRPCPCGGARAATGPACGRASTPSRNRQVTKRSA